MPWLEWCPDPQQPDAQWVKIFHPGSWTPQEEHNAPPPPHTYREWKEFYVPNPDQDGAQPNDSIWSKETGPQRAIGESLPLKLMLEAILRSSDAAAFSTEDLTRLHEGISQQLSDRARHASQQHQPARASRGMAPPESIGVSGPYRPTNPSGSTTAKVKPIFELNDD